MLYQLEYRLNKESEQYPAIYHYHALNRSELLCRRMCDYFVKENKIYKRTSSAKEKDLFVIYVEEVFDEQPFQDAVTYKNVTLEIRLFKEEEPSPLLFTFHLTSHEEAFDFFGNDYFQFGEYEYELICTEIDEDRSTYVLYVDLTGYRFE